MTGISLKALLNGKVTRRRWGRFAIAVAGLMTLLLATNPALAHKFFAGLTRVHWNERAGTVEVTHRLFSHDVEEALSRLEGRTIAFDDDLANQPGLGRYLTQLFVLEADGEAIQLQWIGAELEGELLWAYLEAPMEAPPASARIWNRILFGTFAGQVNTVVATLGGRARSSDFTDQNDLWEVTFERDEGEQDGERE